MQNTLEHKNDVKVRALTVALAGNPNSGKSTIFNALTGARQKVGNYPGVTVESKEGSYHGAALAARVIDLPGTYSLTPYSEEELVARDMILSGGVDVAVNVADAANLERNLYLTLQLLELGTPLALALNMSDIAASRGYAIDAGKLSRALGVPVTATVGHTGEGVEALMAAAETALRGAKRTAPLVDYGPEIEEEISLLTGILNKMPALSGGKPLPPRWAAVKLLESDSAVLACAAPELRAALDGARERVARALDESPESAIASRRYAVIEGICRGAVRSTAVSGVTMSDRIDAVVLNRVLGIPLFLGLMYLVFQLTFTVGTPPMDWIEGGFGRLADLVRSWWPAGSDSALMSLLVDGVIGGVGGVLVFLPNILLLFLAIAVLEDTGYMARAAFIMDRVMHKMGLHGKSFIPMLIGFGCSVPAIMAARTLDNRRDRLATIMVTPLMSCGARLPIYALIIPAFFPKAWQAPVLWGVYVTGIALAILSAKLLRGTVLRGATVPFVMELPPYHLPTLRGVLTHTWERGRLYLKKAGTIILGISILLWWLTSYPKRTEFPADYEALTRQAAALAAPGEAEAKLKELAARRGSEELAFSYAGRIGQLLEPAIRPLGFDWKIGTALIGAFAAKEVFVSQMGIVYSVEAAGDDSAALGARLGKSYSPLVALCIMLFCLISAPCMATIAVTKKETGSWGWALFQLGGLTALAYIVTFAVFQGGKLAGFGG